MLKVLDKIPSVLRHLYVSVVILFSFVIFNHDTLIKVADYFKGMFGMLDIPFASVESNYYMNSYFLVIVMSILGTTPLILLCCLISLK